MRPFFCLSKFSSIVVLGLVVCTATVAAPASRVFDAPAGSAVGAIRDGDQVKMLEYQTVYRDGTNERWAYVEYGDIYSKATGWIRLDNLRVEDSEIKTSPRRSARPTPPIDQTPDYSQPSASYRPPSSSQSLADTSIRDMDIDCYENRRGAIGGCDLSVQADIKTTGYSNGEAVLVCQAELHWTRVGGEKQVSSSRGQQVVDLYGGNLRKRVVLNFDFGSAGASGAMVENQQCQTQAASFDEYADDYQEYDNYR